jgi:hypothetical protein
VPNSSLSGLVLFFCSLFFSSSINFIIFFSFVFLKAKH